MIITAEALRAILADLRYETTVDWGEEDSAGFLNPTISKGDAKICACCGGL